MIETGYSFYGQRIGVLVNASTSPRVPGDAGHSESFCYPVRYQITGTSFMDMVDGSPEAREKIICAARALEEMGVKGIVADCGLMSRYQEDVAREVGICFVGASLCQLPLIWTMIGKSGTIGIITGHSRFLKEDHLRSSGWNESIKIEIEGMENYSHFSEIVINGGMNLDTELMKKDVVDAASALQKRTPDLKAIILECSNLATYSKYVAEETGLPVFDTISATDLMEYALNPPEYI